MKLPTARNKPLSMMVSAPVKDALTQYAAAKGISLSAAAAAILEAAAVKMLAAVAAKDPRVASRAKREQHIIETGAAYTLAKAEQTRAYKTWRELTKVPLRECKMQFAEMEEARIKFEAVLTTAREAEVAYRAALAQDI